MVNNPDFTTGSANSDTPGFSFVQKAGTLAKPYPTFCDCTDSFVSEAQEDQFNIQVGQSACFESQDGSRVAAVTVLSWDKQNWVMYADVNQADCKSVIIALSSAAKLPN